MLRSSIVRLAFVCLWLLVTILPAAPASHAQSTSVYHGVVHYRMRGPGAAPHGIGSALLLGGIGAPVALVRVQNMLRTALDIISRMPSAKADPSISTVSEWAHNGVPIDLASLLPISGAYEATVRFTLRSEGKGTYVLESGTVNWTASNDMRLSGEDIQIVDRFNDAGTDALEPGADEITLRIDSRSDPPTFELDVSIGHPCTISGESSFIVGPLGEIMNLSANRGHMTMGGIGGVMSTEDMGAAPDAGIYYARHGTLSNLRGIEVWRDLLDNMVLVEYNLYSTLRADAGGPYEFRMGDAVPLDGSQSEGDITKWKWTFAPGPGCSPEGPFNQDAEKEGVRTNTTLLCDTRITLTVEDAAGNTDTDEVVATRIGREWETTYEGPLNRAEADAQEGTLSSSILVMVDSQGNIRGARREIVGGRNVNYRDNDESATFDPPGTGRPRSWDGEGYEIAQVTDPDGPFDGMYYLDDYRVAVHRRTLVNVYYLPPPLGRAPMEEMELFYTHNKNAGHDVDGFLEGIRTHEFEHGEVMREAIAQHDTAPELERMYAADRNTLKEDADEALDGARLKVCIASLDPLPGGVTWPAGGGVAPLEYPGEHGAYALGETNVGEAPPRSRAEREAICRQ